MMSSIRTDKSGAARSGHKVRNVRVTYADLADVVLKIDQFRFLEDVIPRSNPFASRDAGSGGKGQREAVAAVDDKAKGKKLGFTGAGKGSGNSDETELADVVESNALRGQSTLPFFGGGKKLRIGERGGAVISKVVGRTRDEEEAEEEEEEEEEIVDEDEGEDEDVTDEGNVESENESDHEETEEEESHEDQHVKIVKEQLQEIERLDRVEDLDRRNAAKSANNIMLNRNQEVDDAEVGDGDSTDENEEEKDMESISSSFSDDL